MKVLMQSRRNFFSLPGGDTIQLVKTKEQLEKIGVHVDISLDFEPDLSSYDVVHLSNVTRIQETYLQLKNAIKQQKPVVLSTIFWPMDDFEKNGQLGIRRIIGKILNINQEEKIKAIVRYLKDKDSRNEATSNLWKIGYNKMQQFVINNVDYFLPNSEMEMNEIREYFGVKNNNYCVIPNAVDDDFVTKQNTLLTDDEFLKFKNAVVCVGRIETRKNQLSLVKALDGTGIKLLLVGKPSNNQKEYFQEIKKYIDNNNNFYHIESIDHEKIYQLFKVCKVSVLPSWLDTPGLVSLEAGAMGCNIVSTTKGSTREYFKDYAFYCEPDDINSIKQAILNALEKEKNNDLKNHILQNYTWKIAAEKTYHSYKKVLECKQIKGDIDGK